jgi:hypothetical protein
MVWWSYYKEFSVKEFSVKICYITDAFAEKSIKSSLKMAFLHILSRKKRCIFLGA